MHLRIDKDNLEDIYPMSDIARGMIFYSLTYPGDSAYHNQMAFRMRDRAFDLSLFGKAFGLLVEKHEILRTGFKMFGFKEPLQIVYRKITFNIDQSDISALSFAQQQEEVRGFLEADRRVPFEFTALEPLWRMKIFFLGEGDILIIWICHHAIIDGWSSASLVTELNNTYQALKINPAFVPVRLQGSYKDFVIQQVAAKKNQAIIDFWKNYLADYKRFELPGRGEGVTAGDSGSQAKKEEKKRNKYESRLDTGILEQLRKAAVGFDTSLKNLCFAAYIYMLNTLSYDNEVVVGLITNNRPVCPDGDKIIGCFLNTVPVRIVVPGNITWKEFIELVTGELRRLKTYDMLPFFEITRMLGEEVRDRNPVTDTIFNYVDFHVYNRLQVGEGEAAVGSEFSLGFDDSGATNTLFDFTVDITGGDFVVSITYSTSILGEAGVKRLYGRFERILGKFIREPGVLMNRVELIPGEERQKLLEEFNETGKGDFNDKSIDGIFSRQQEQTPDYIALVGQEERNKNSTGKTDNILLTYRELNEKADRLAECLKEKGVTSGEIVGIMLGRYVEMAIGILGILKAGGAYLPIAPDYPKDRIHYMLRDSGARILLGGDSGEIEDENRIDGLIQVQINISINTNTHTNRELLPVGIGNNSTGSAGLAYVIYTSGSTGRPKGVLVEHGNVVRLVRHTNYMKFRKGDRLLLTGAIGFDITTFEIWFPLLNGLVLYLAEQDIIIEAERLRHFIVRNRISLLHLIPQLFNQMADRQPGLFDTLRYLLVGGDVVRPYYVNQIRQRNKELNILHMYGPTENTTFSTFFPVKRDYTASIPIGKPIANSSIYILDRQGQLQPMGSAGELYTGGSGTARGYLNKPQLTSERFTYCQQVNNKKFCGGPGGGFIKEPPGRRRQRMYKTGDLGRWSDDGNLEFSGRIDQQVKIRGFRIELGEIENCLQAYRDIKEVVVVLSGREPDIRQIRAYVVMTPGKVLNSTHLREYLLQRLPAYMIPGHFIQLEKIPITATGKIDRKLLPEPDNSGKRGEAYVPAGNEIERKLVEIWEALLSREGIGIHDNFFALGGDSIQAIQVAARMNEAGYRLETRDILQGKSIAQLALLARKRERTADQSVVEGVVPLTPIQERFFQVNPDMRSRNLFSQAVLLYRQERFEESVTRKIFTKLVRHHDALRMVFLKRNGVIVQENRGIEAEGEGVGRLFDLEVFDFGNMEGCQIEREIRNNAGRIIESMDLEKGPLVKLGLFKTGKGDHLLIVIHHLVVDGISWRILFEDIKTAYDLCQQGKEPVLPAKTDSFKSWSEKLSQYAAGSVLRELPYWKTLELEAATVLCLGGSGNRGTSGENRTSGNVETIEVGLNRAETETLLSRVNHAYNTEINDILLAALGLAVTRWVGGTKVLIDLESHGREPIFEEIDITRTVGWFTAQYPVLLDIGPGEDLSYTIKSVKETLRRIPARGIGYGILRYLTAEEKKAEYRFQCEAEISFNYLGQWEEENQDGSIGISHLRLEDNPETGMEQRHALVINGMKTGGELKFAFSYNENEFDRNRMQHLADSFASYLRRIISHCSQKEEGEFTPSDLGCQRISLGEFSRITGTIAAEIPGSPSIEALYPLSPMQSGMLYHALKNPEVDTYFVQSIFHLEGRIEKTLLEISVNRLLHRYDVLRTVFLYEELEEPLQAVLKGRSLSIDEEDISGLSDAEKTSYIREFRKQDEKKGFHLGKDILMRLTLLKTGRNSYSLVWSYHHLLMDGWCLGIIYKELIDIYRHLEQGRGIEETAFGAVTPYKHYIHWLEKQDQAADLAYWRDYLEGYDQPAVLPQFGPNQGEDHQHRKAGYQRGEYDLVIPEELLATLKSVAGQNRVTLSTMFQALWGLLLQTYNNCNDVVFGAVVSGRPPEIQGIEHMVGLFINTVPLRIQTTGTQTFSQLLTILQKNNTLTRSYEYLPLAEIQAQSALRANLFDHIMVFENYPLHEEVKKIETGEGTGIVKDIEIHEQTNYDFNIVIMPGRPFLLKFTYNARVYDGETLRRIDRHFNRILVQVVKYPGIRREEIEIITSEEKQMLLVDFNRRETVYPGEKLIHRLFEEQAKQTPDRVALVEAGENRQLSYRELNRQSDRLAHVLIEKGVHADMIVAIMLERSIRMITGILGILKAGGAYLPIEPDYPRERMDYMLEESGAQLLVTETDRMPVEAVETKTSDQLKPKLEIIFIDRIEFITPSPFLSTHSFNSSNLSYVLYTSGSTGRPKGVLAEHGSVVNYLKWAESVYLQGEKSDFPLYSSLSVDLTVTSLYLPIISGNRAIIYDDNRETEPVISRIIRENRVQVIKLTPTHLQLLKELDISHSSVKKLIVGGEELTAVLAGEIYQKFNRAIEIYNEYGPTETVVGCTLYKYDPAEPRYSTVLIGSPVANAGVCICDGYGKLQPPGIPGELWVFGSGVTRGYLNKPGLTLERYINYKLQNTKYKKNTNHKSQIIENWRTGNIVPGEETRPPNKKLLPKMAGPGGGTTRFLEKSPPGCRRHNGYRTGDLGRWLRGGNLQFLGRIDQQVKIRGYRIELAEIESRLLAFEGIKEAVVVDWPAGKTDKYLCAYIVPHHPGMLAGNSSRAAELNRYLSAFLPGHMIPSYFIETGQLPLTASGKVDRRALPVPGQLPAVEYVPPRNKIEEKLTVIWQEVLEREGSSISIHDNFFQLGGHSLKAMILTAKIHKVFHVKFSLSEVFKRQTIRELSEYISSAAREEYTGIEPVEKKEYYTLSSAQKRLYFLQQMDMNSTGYNMPLFLPLGKDVEINQLETALKQLIARHDSLRTSFVSLENQPVQRVHDAVVFKMEYYDLSGSGIQEPDEQEGTGEPGGIWPGELAARTITKFIRSFDLGRAPLIRSGIVRLPDFSYTWMVDIHHIVSDGTSQSILSGEFMSLLQGEQLAPLRLHYKDFSAWQVHLFNRQSGGIKAQEDYWLELYADAAEIRGLQLPADFKRPEVFTFAGAHYGFMLDPEEAVRFRQLGSRLGATLYMNILAALNTLFYRYTGQADIIIGTGVAGRPHADLQCIIGMFVNTLAMRNYPHGSKTYELFLREVITQSVSAFENQDVQFEALVDKLGLERDPARNPLFDITMVVQNMMRPETTGVTVPIEENTAPAIVEYESTTSKFDLTFFINEQEENIYIDIEYYTGIFEEETVQRLVSHFNNVIRSVTRSPGLQLKDIEIISPQEKQQVLFEYNDTSTSFPGDKTLDDLFEELTRKIPDHIALVGINTRFISPDSGRGPYPLQLTYRELDRQSNRLANYLLAGKQNQGEEMVGILMERSTDQLIALLGILKSGSAYLPIDPLLPIARIKHIIEDAGLGIMVSQKQMIRTLNRLQWECRHFHTFLCLDSEDIYSEEEIEKSQLMDEELWDIVAETATDDITAGGWFTSYTGEPFTREEMDEYADNVLKKLSPLLHRDMNILEIGCGSGLSMFRLAPLVRSYHALDLSEKVIEHNRKLILEKGGKNITLSVLPAHEIDKIAEHDFDMVIINSVIQSFPGHNYLRQVIARAIRLLNRQGYLFIGDILDHDLKDVLIRDMMAFKFSSLGTAKTKTDWEADLFVSRSFFEDQRYQHTSISSVEFSRKIHTIENELTKYRYDTLITIDKSVTNQENLNSKQKCQHDARALNQFTPHAPVTSVIPESLAYVIYTSGSTGVSKGVMIEHRNVVRLIKDTNYIEYIDFQENDRFLLTGAFSFDITTFEIWGTLLNNVRLYMVDKDTILDAGLLQETIVKNNISIMHFIPQLFQQHLENDPQVFQSLRLIMVGGDWVGPGSVSQLRERYKYLKILHMYGPTENTTFSTFFPVEQDFDDRLPIGKPISNSTVYILDDWLHPQPLKVPGELCTGGDGVARGYLNRPELTFDRFRLRRPGGLFSRKRVVPPPGPAIFGKSFLLDGSGDYGGNVYKSGDLGRWLPDGNIEFFGRIDQQVKIRGFRVELEEIENQLVKHSGIKEAVVTAPEDKNNPGEKFLCAYVIMKSTGLQHEWDSSELRQFLSGVLPEYMIPAYFVPMETFPLTTSGKIDRNALPPPEKKATDTCVPPRHDVEKSLADIWAKVLGEGTISIEDNFFELGGHSLKAAMMVQTIQKEMGVKVPLAEIFKFPTIRLLARFIQSAAPGQFTPIEAIEKKEYYELSYNQKRLWFIFQKNPASTSYHMPELIALDFQVDIKILEWTLYRIFERHDSLRTGFKLIGGEPIQFIPDLKDIDIPFQVKDISQLDENEKEPLANQLIAEIITQPFDLQKPPLFRSILIKKNRNDFLLVYNMHHIITDGWSMGILKEEFSKIYQDYSHEKQPGPEPLHLQYKDFTVWHNRQIQEPGAKDNAHKYWQEKLKSGLPVLKLIHHYRPDFTGNTGDYSNQDHRDRGGRYRCAVSKEIKERMFRLAKENQTSPFIVLFTMYNLLMAYLSGQDDIAVDVISAGRQHASMYPIVGYFVYPLIIKTRVNINEGFGDLLTRVNRDVTDAFQYQAYPFELVLDDLKVKFPEVTTAFNMLNIQDISPEMELESTAPYHMENIQEVKFDIVIFVMEYKNGMEFIWEYRKMLFTPDTIETIAQNYLALMEDLTDKDNVENAP